MIYDSSLQVHCQVKPYLVFIFGDPRKLEHGLGIDNVGMSSSAAQEYDELMLQLSGLYFRVWELGRELFIGSWGLGLRLSFGLWGFWVFRLGARDSVSQPCPSRNSKAALGFSF